MIDIMNEQALQDSYKLFTETGYNGSLEDYKTLLSENEEARSDAHNLFTNTGYNGSLDDFNTLVGVNVEKKNSNDSTELSWDDSDSGLQSLDVQPVGFQQGIGEIAEGTTEGDTKLDQAKNDNITVNKGRKTQELGAVMGKMAQEEEEALGRWAGYLGGADVEAPSTQASENLSPFAATLARTEESKAEELIKNAKTEEEVRAIIRAKNADEVNAAYDDAMITNTEATMTEDVFTPEGKQSKGGLIEYDESGKAVFNEKNIGLTLMDMDAVALKEQRMREEEEARVEGRSTLGLIRHDFATGVMDITNSVQALYDREGAQDDIYANTFRTNASYAEYGLTEEEISKGVSKNLEEGNIGAASAVFAVQAAQTAPQLLSQVAIAYATGGLGMSASASMWASSGFMGATTFGRTWADTYGQMSNEKAFMLALGDAAVETISERLFTSDVKALSGVGVFEGMTRKQIQKEMFQKGLFSTEFRKFATMAGKETFKAGAEEGLEEIMATVGSGIVHAAINDEEINLYEVMDAAILGFGMGAGARTAGKTFKSQSLLTAGVSALGYGGLRSSFVNIKNNKQKLAKELMATTDANKRAVLTTKIKELEQLQSALEAEQELAYDQYSDEDANNTLEANQKLSQVLYKLRNSELTAEQKTELQAEAKAQYDIISSIESKYESNIQAIKEQRATNSDFLNGLETSLEVNKDSKLPDTPLMKGIMNVAKALAPKGVKVLIHKNLDDAAEVAGVDKLEIAGSNGFYKAADGTIHIMASIAQNNTAYHEGFHSILREVDPSYAKRFVDGAFRGMDTETAAKYKKIYNANLKKGGQELAVEEVFAELSADIATGAISQEGAGASIVGAAMSSLKKSLNAIGVPVKAQPSFKEFATFISKVTTDFQVGDAVTESKGAFGSNEMNNDNFLQMNEEEVNKLNAAKEDTIEVEISERFETEETILSQIPTGKNLVYHGSPDISWAESESINTSDNTNNASSKYLFLAESPSTAYNYSVPTTNGVGKMSKNSGIVVSSIKPNAKTHRLTSKDVEGADTIEKLEKVYDSLKEKGIDVIVNTLDANNKIVLNNDVVSFNSVHYNQESLNKEEAKKATIEVEKGKTFTGSFINGDTNFTNLAEVVENFKKENGRAPKILFWMGDQSARGTYKTLDGNDIELEGGISFSQDSENVDNGVVWATNKNNNEVQGLVKDADIVAIVSGKPETGHRFYKGTSVVVGTELMEAFNRKKGESVLYPQRSGNFEIEIPAEGFTDPLAAMRFFYSTLSENNIDLTSPKEFMEKSEGFATQQEYLDASKGDRMGALDFFLEPSQTAVSFFENLGMKPIAEMQKEMRDGYLVENEFTTGDIYAFYEFERDADGKVVTQGGKHSTYSTDIKGKALGIANRKDNIYQVADLAASTTSEKELSGESKVEMALAEGLLNKEEVAEMQTLEKDSKERQNAKKTLIAKAAVEARRQGNFTFANRIKAPTKKEIEEFGISGISTLKSGYVSVDKAGDKALKRVVSDAGTSYDGDVLLESLIAGQTMDGRQDALNKAAQELVEEGKAKEVEFKDGKKKFIDTVLPVGLVLERAARNEGVDFKAMQESVNPETKRKAAIFHQATIVDETAQRILYGEKKADIVASLRAKGMSRADANLVYAKASQFAKGAKKGWSEGTKERSAQLAAKRKEERKAESAKAKDFRKKAAAILKQEKKTGDIILREMMNLIKEAGVDIKASQVQTLIRIAKKVSRAKGRGVLDTDARYELLNSVVDKVVKIIDKQLTSQGLDEYTNRLRKVEKEQKKLRDRFTKLKPTSRSPLISYAEQILDMTSLNPAMLSPENLILLESTIKDLNITTKSVGVRGEKLGLPYVQVEGLGYVDIRRAKLYFDEIFENLKAEEVSLQEKSLVNQAADLAFENGTDWVTEYEGLMADIAKKDLKGVQKKLTEIAEDLGLDLNDINDFAIAEKIYSEEKEEKLNKQKQTIIDDAILPTFMNFRRLFESNDSFALIFNIPANTEDAVAAEIVKARMDKLTALELKRLEFGMYDFAVNGRALGMSQLAAHAVAKNDNNPRLSKLNLKSREKEGAGKGVFGRFENTPSYFRRIFLTSEVKIAKFMDIIGFSELRSAVSQADAQANVFDEFLVKRARELNVTSLKSQVKMQILSVLSQVPAGKNATQHLAQVIANLELALVSDKRFSEEQKKEIRESLDEALYTSDGKRKNYDEIMTSFEGTNEAQMVFDMQQLFGIQSIKTKRYAEEFLGMNFKEEDNYLPIKFRSVGSTNDNISRLQESIDNIQSAFRSYGLSSQNKQASSTFERNDESMGSKTRYLDLNFLDSLSKGYRESEVKALTAPAVAKMSTMTSESNEEFKATVVQPEQRQKIRKKAMLFLTENAQAVEAQDELLGQTLKKVGQTLNNFTVLYYFGSVTIQVFKQSSALFNTIAEGGNVFNILSYVMQATTGTYNRGQKEIMRRSDIGQRDYIKETVSATVKGNAVTENGTWASLREKGMEISTFGLRQTDKIAATASWLAYYEQYQRKENGFTGSVSDDVWLDWSRNQDKAAADYATLMVTKDQNISTSRDKSEFRNLNSGQVAQFVQMIVMPFANFLINKKLNLMLDFQRLAKGETRIGAIRSIGGTAMEVAAFHGVSQFVIAPMIMALANAISGGGEEEEESWFDNEFRWGLFKKGMLSDLNPLVMPVGAMERWATTAYNMIDYMATDDAMKHDFADRTWYENFQAWEKINGMPKFGGVGRGDMSWITALKSGGVYGDMTVEFVLAAKNLTTLSEKNPYYVTSFGTKKFLSTEDAKKMFNLEMGKLSMMTIGGMTGLFAKESVAAIKMRERQVGRRGITNENEAIGRMIINEGKGTDIMLEKVESNIKDNPLGIEGTVQGIVGDKTIKSIEADKLPSNKYINTIRDIKVKTTDARDAALAAKVVMQSMTPEEAAEFKTDFLKYYALKEGENALVKIVTILNQ